MAKAQAADAELVEPDARAANARHGEHAAAARGFVSLFAAATDATMIVASAFAIGWAYHLIALGEHPFNENLMQIGGSVALLFALPNALRGEYDVARYLAFDGHRGRVFQVWNIAFVAVIILGFVTKTSMTFSRGTVLLLYVGGFGALIAGRALLVRLVQISAKTGTVSARRIFLVGTAEEVSDFAVRHQPWNLGMQVVGMRILPREADARALEAAIDDAVVMARTASPDDVFILTGWDRKETIDGIIDRFLTIPASIHLGADPLLARFADVRMSRIGTVASLQIVRKPLGYLDVKVKRAFDVTASLIGLVLLAPLFAVVAILIKLDSRGPVLFRQRRYGFNKQPFRILKFRTMFTMDDGDVVVQATSGDARITRVGRVLRRWNIDELPQLVNVLKGDMSLVGPRPHALAHDHAYERRIALYARRHNVKPGITGLAQVNGLRGETDTDDKMRARVELDLAYIDNWSLWRDIEIIARTLVSPRAYHNAG